MKYRTEIYNDGKGDISYYPQMKDSWLYDWRCFSESVGGKLKRVKFKTLEESEEFMRKQLNKQDNAITSTITYVKFKP